MNKEQNVILNSKINRSILIYLNKKFSDYSMNVGKGIKCSTTGSLNKFKELKDNGLIEKIDNKRFPFNYRDNRIKYFRLTNKGKRIVGLLLEINKEIKKE